MSSTAPLTFVATGDAIISRRLSVLQDLDFLQLKEMIANADAAFSNLEVMTPRRPWIPASEFGGGYLAAEPFVLDELQAMGFNLFNVANNHATDYTYKGLTDTIAELRARDMRFAGGGDTLGEARSPTYLDTARGRVALLGVASSFVIGGLAAASRSDAAGRPGVNPLRFETEYLLPTNQMQQLQAIDNALGSQAVTERKRAFGALNREREGAYPFLGNHFREAEQAAIVTMPHQGDMEAISKQIADARRQASLVVVSLHAHQGQNGDSNSDTAADFIETAARRWIDAGADVIVGHGPHMLRGIEIYCGKPIFYSLGNFIFTFETVIKQPTEMYEQHDLGADATPADVEDAWTHWPDGSPKGFHADEAFWQTALPLCHFSEGRLERLELHPISISLHVPRDARGVPRLMSADEGRKLLEHLQELSVPYGSTIDIHESNGRTMGTLRL